MQNSNNVTNEAQQNDNNNNNNISPEHFPQSSAAPLSQQPTDDYSTTGTTPTTTTTITAAAAANAIPTTTTTRTQNFSFSSAYTTSRFSGQQQPQGGANNNNNQHYYNNHNNNNNNSQHYYNTNNHNRHNNSQLFRLNYKPISAFTVLSEQPLQQQQHQQQQQQQPLLYNPSTFNAKPNAIVRPIRRATDDDDDDADADDAGGLHGGQRQRFGAATTTTTAAIAQSQQPQQQQQLRDNSGEAPEVRHFADELQRKLRFLRRPAGAADDAQGHSPDGGGGGGGAWRHSPVRGDSPNKYSTYSGSQAAGLDKRPLFITTVPTGVYLPPSNEASLPAFLARRIYAFSSHPVIFGYGSAAGGGQFAASTAATTMAPLYASYASASYKAPTAYNNYNHIYAKDKTQQQLGSNNNGGDKQQSVVTAPAQLIAAADKKAVFSVTNAARGQMAPAATGGGGGGFGAGSGGGGGGGAGSSAYDSPALASGVHVTRQQFQQQIQQRRAKRETAAPVEPYKNVMYDRRVVRGSNFTNTQLLSDSDPFDKAAELRRRHALRKKAQCRNQRNVLGTPPPVAGRHHEVIQTEKYLEELVQRPPEFSVDTQTDLFLERPPTPPYIPAKVGVDVATEIGDGELFHFDAEAQPIIDILVDACIEQSMLEVAHEEEIGALRRKQEEYLAQRETELAELRRLEAEEIRLQAEKERRLRQDTIAKELDAEMQKGVTAAKLLQGHIASLLPEVLENLEPASDAAKKEQLMKTICPWLTKEVAEEVGHIVDSREILTVIIQEIIKQRAEVYAGYKDETPGDGLPMPPADGEAEEDGEQEPDCCECESEPSTQGCQPPEPNA